MYITCTYNVCTCITSVYAMYIQSQWGFKLYRPIYTVCACTDNACTKRYGLNAELRLAGVARLIGPDWKWSVVVNKVHTSTYCVRTLYIRVCTCIYHVRMEIVILEGIWCNNQLTVLAWCIQQWFKKSLQAGTCHDRINYWKMYRHVYYIMYIHTIWNLPVCIWHV